MNARGRAHRLAAQGRHCLAEREIGLGCDEFRRPLGDRHAGRQDHRARLRLLKQRQVLFVGNEADLVAPGVVDARDIRDFALAVALQLRAANLRQVLELHGRSYFGIRRMVTVCSTVGSIALRTVTSKVAPPTGIAAGAVYAPASASSPTPRPRLVKRTTARGPAAATP